MLLTEVEQRTLDAYVEMLHERLGKRLVAVRVFGSVARGESWPPSMPIRSDLDLLVLRPGIDADAVEVWPCR